MLDKSRFSLNRIIYPGLDLEGFFKLTQGLGLSKVELRNDLPGGKMLDDFSSQEVKALTDRYGMRILTINAIQQFNLGSLLDQVYQELQEMLKTASAIGCGAIVLCPNNDVADTRTQDQCFRETVAALKKFAPLFEENGMIGLVEPLGFEECSLRSKETAVKAIQETGFAGYKLVHDTFHHYLSGDDTFYPASTGLVHISGVETRIPKAQIKDAHRILIGAQDLMANKQQIDMLETQGYSGNYSFEPFSADVQQMSLDELKEAIEESLKFIRAS
jgi:2-keto-myo-inositol isomerase